MEEMYYMKSKEVVRHVQPYKRTPTAVREVHMLEREMPAIDAAVRMGGGGCGFAVH